MSQQTPAIRRFPFIMTAASPTLNHESRVLSEPVLRTQADRTSLGMAGLEA